MYLNRFYGKGKMYFYKGCYICVLAIIIWITFFMKALLCFDSSYMTRSGENLRAL